MSRGAQEDGAQKEGKAVSSGAGGQRIGARTYGYASGRKGGIGKEEEAGEAQADAGEIAGGNRVKQQFTKSVKGSRHRAITVEHHRTRSARAGVAARPERKCMA